MGSIRRERHIDRERKREWERQIDKQTDRQTDRQTWRRREREREGRETEREGERERKYSQILKSGKDRQNNIVSTRKEGIRRQVLRQNARAPFIPACHWDGKVLHLQY